MAPTLVLLAAGMSTRYGRLKQLEPVGPGGETLLDFSVFDARKAGFGRVVLIIREELEDRFRRHVRERWPRDLEVEYHHQRLDDLAGATVRDDGGGGSRGAGASPELMGRLVSERTKPWGTAHALLSARDLLPEPFAILNADDFYGESAFLRAASWLARGPERNGDGRPVFGLMGYTLRDTLSPHGGVNRGICRLDREGWLEEVEEILEIRAVNGGAQGVTVPGEGVILTGREATSTNFWIFTPDLFPFLEKGFQAFLEWLAYVEQVPEGRGAVERERANGMAGQEEKPRNPEFLIPTEINRLLTHAKIRVKVLEVEGPFFGITHPEDREWVAKGIAGLMGNGRYPGAGDWMTCN